MIVSHSFDALTLPAESPVIDLWTLPLDRLLPLKEDWERWLSQDEREQASRFRFPRDRDRYILTRGGLRSILGAYQQEPPERLRFTYNAHGKPFLECEDGLQFNVSHTQDRAVVAVTRGRRIGIDIESLTPSLDYRAMAERFFAPKEREDLNTRVAEAQYPLAFLQAWTRKEAYLKALGTGLSVALDQVVVTLLPGEDARLLCAPDNNDEKKWSMYSNIIEEGYVMAIVTERGFISDTIRDFSLQETGLI